MAITKKILEELGYKEGDHLNLYYKEKVLRTRDIMYKIIMVFRKERIAIAIGPKKRPWGAAYYYVGKCETDKKLIQLLKDTGQYDNPSKSRV